jgi:hypothetical protein
MVLVRRPGDCAEDSVREERKTREDRRSGCCASQDNAHVLYGRSWCCVQGAVPRAARSRGDGRGVSHSHHAGASSRRRWAGCCCDAVGSHVDACVSVQLELDIVHNGRVEACAPQRVGPTAGARRTRGCGCHGHNLGNTTLALSTAATQPMSIISVPPRCQALIHYPTRGRASHTPPGHSPARPPCAPPHPHPTHTPTPTLPPPHTHPHTHTHNHVHRTISPQVAWVPIISNAKSLFIYVQSVSNYLAPPITCIFVAALLFPGVPEHAAFWGMVVGELLGLTRLCLELVRKNTCDDPTDCSTCSQFCSCFVTADCGCDLVHLSS